MPAELVQYLALTTRDILPYRLDAIIVQHVVFIHASSLIHSSSANLPSVPESMFLLVRIIILCQPTTFTNWRPIPTINLLATGSAQKGCWNCRGMCTIYQISVNQIPVLLVVYRLFSMRLLARRGMRFILLPSTSYQTPTAMWTCSPPSRDWSTPPTSP